MANSNHAQESTQTPPAAPNPAPAAPAAAAPASSPISQQELLEQQRNTQIESVLDMLRQGSQVNITGQQTLGGNRLEVPKFSNIYNISSCREGGRSSSPRWVMCVPPALWGQTAFYDYWEPAAIVEVSCQKGTSFLKPDLMQQGPQIAGQQVRPGQCGVGPNWFFEVRVWASNPEAWGDRAIIHGEGFRRQTGYELCAGEGTTDRRSRRFGYGMKYGFTKGPMTGPAGSYEAYISDRDPTWSEQLKPTDSNNTAAITQSMQQSDAEVKQLQTRLQRGERCQPGTPDVPYCWGGKEDQFSGWVTHPNRAVAAALASLRGVRKAQSLNMMAREIQGGLRMSMDYPFLKAPSAYAQSLGAQGGQTNTQHRGSDCFVPGEPGTWWYTDGRRNDDPNAQLPRAITTPNAAATASADAGIYIFSYWVKTSCTAFSQQAGACNDRHYY